MLSLALRLIVLKYSSSPALISNIRGFARRFTVNTSITVAPVKSTLKAEVTAYFAVTFLLAATAYIATNKTNVGESMSAFPAKRVRALPSPCQSAWSALAKPASALKKPPQPASAPAIT